MFLVFLVVFCLLNWRNLRRENVTNNKKPKIQSGITNFFKNNNKWVLSDSMLRKIQAIYIFSEIFLFYKHILLEQKGCAYFERSPYHECAYYERAQYTLSLFNCCKILSYLGRENCHPSLLVMAILIWRYERINRSERI